MIASVRRAFQLVEDLLKTYGKLPEDRVRRELEDQGIAADRVDDAIRLGLVRGRFVRRTEDGETVLKRLSVDTPRFDPRIGRGRR